MLFIVVCLEIKILAISNTGCLEGRQTGIKHRMFRRQADSIQHRMFRRQTDRYPKQEVHSRVVDPYSFFTDPDPDPELDGGGQYGSGSGSNTDPGL